jgi:hypothetical protein
MAISYDSKNKNVDQLNSFLRGELSAVETYRIAMEKLPVESPSRGRLAACLDSHYNRVDALRMKIRSLGGQPSEGAGAWGAMTTALETSASALGEKAAIAVLEQGEDHGLADYRADLDKLDFEARDMVTGQLLPSQEETHRVLSQLKKELGNR